MTTATMPMSLRVDTHLRQRLSVVARNEKRSSHAIALDALQAYVTTKEDQTKWNAEAMESYNHFKETGLHVSFDELDSWLATWGKPNETPMPQCHT